MSHKICKNHLMKSTQDERCPYCVAKEQAEQLELYASRWASAMSEITKLQAELDASQSSHKALETLYLQVRDEELAEKDKEIARLKDLLYDLPYD